MAFEIRNPEQVAKFKTRINQLPKLWKYLDIRVLAVEVDDEWHNLFTQIELCSERVQLQRFQIPRSFRIACWHVQLPVSKLTRLVDEIGTGATSINGHDVLYRQYSNSTDVPVGYRSVFDFYAHSSTYQPYNDPLSFSAIRLRLYSDDAVSDLLSKAGLKSDLDHDLLSLRRPIDGLDSLSHFVAEKSTWGAGHYCQVHVLAPMNVRISASESHFDHGKLTLALESSTKIATEFCRVIRSWSTASRVPHTERIAVLKDSWRESECGWKALIEMDHRTSRHVDVVLELAGWRVDRKKLADYSGDSNNVRVKGYKSIDPEMDLLRTWLFTEKKRASTDFELGVARVLLFCGFHVDVFSGSNKALSEAIDAIAYSPFSDVVLAVECTLGSLDNGGKLGKLVTRTHLLRKALPGKDVHPVLCTALMRTELADGELENASTEGVIVIGAEELGQMLESAVANSEFATTETYILSLVPPQSAEMRDALDIY